MCVNEDIVASKPWASLFKPSLIFVGSYVQ